MPVVRVSIVLPYGLLLPSGDYPTTPQGHPVHLAEAVSGPSSGEIAEHRTVVSSVFLAADLLGEESAGAAQQDQAVRLLRQTNRLLRWYRAVSRNPQVVDLSRAQASPFHFVIDGTAEIWRNPLNFEAVPLNAQPPIDDVHVHLRAGLATGVEPPVADLSLLDAEHALRTGRFREAVLFCWSAIDATFSRKYAALVDGALAGEWMDAKRFFRGHADIPLRYRMSAMMHLIANRSLYREPDGLWTELSISYDHRNNIIHSGANATEADAELAIRVARRIIHIMHTF